MTKEVFENSFNNNVEEVAGDLNIHYLGKFHSDLLNNVIHHGFKEEDIKKSLDDDIANIPFDYKEYKWLNDCNYFSDDEVKYYDDHKDEYDFLQAVVDYIKTNLYDKSLKKRQEFYDEVVNFEVYTISPFNMKNHNKQLDRTGFKKIVWTEETTDKFYKMLDGLINPNDPNDVTYNLYSNMFDLVVGFTPLFTGSLSYIHNVCFDLCDGCTDKDYMDYIKSRASYLYFLFDKSGLFDYTSRIKGSGIPPTPMPIKFAIGKDNKYYDQLQKDYIEDYNRVLSLCD